MQFSNIRVIYCGRNVVATARVAGRDECFAGLIDLGLMPAQLRQKFEEYEELVNGQMFGLLDELEEQIAALPLKVIFEEGTEFAVADLQIFPDSGRVSFKLLPELAPAWAAI